MPGTRQIKITAPTAGARKNLDVLIDKLGQTPKSKNVKVSAPTAAAIKSLEAVQAKIRATPGAKSVRVSAPTGGARKELESLGFRIEKIPGSKDVKVTVPTGGPKKAADTIQGRINALRGKEVTVTTRHVSIFSQLAEQNTNIADAIEKQAEAQARAAKRHADGAVVDYFADGGFTGGQRRERHVAQIAPAGSYRIWGERETGGEAYVPLAASKRERSKAIVEEVVDRFGGQVEWYANGGIRGRSSRDYNPMLASSFKQARSVAAMAGVVRSFDIRTGSDRARTRVVDARAGGAAHCLIDGPVLAAGAGGLVQAERQLRQLVVVPARVVQADKFDVEGDPPVHRVGCAGCLHTPKSPVHAARCMPGPPASQDVTAVGIGTGVGGVQGALQPGEDLGGLHRVSGRLDARLEAQGPRAVEVPAR
ncbi:hypothetical protein ACFWNK_22640 [Streptomyces sp. NPDC058417]|uniref:hypothetical protein n=1 Tax=unclassified Streptomyces TaxID=2593676 RepID=UPI0036468211